MIVLMKLRAFGAELRSRLNSDGSKNRHSETHALRLTGRGCYYSFSFDLGPGLDIFTVTDRLLTDNLATVAASPATDSLRVSREVAGLTKIHHNAETFEQFLTEMYSDDPRMKTLYRISKGWSLKIGYAVAKSAFESLFRPSENIENDRMEATRKIVHESEEQLREHMMSYHIDGALRVRIEQKEHYPRYFNSEPYIRLEMAPVLFNDNIVGNSSISVSLMLHRSGICIFTFTTDAGKDMDFDQISSLGGANSRKLEHLKISRPVMAAYAAPRRSLAGWRNRRKTLRADEQWVTITKDDAKKDGENLTITTAFLAYLGALENVSRKKMSEWHCFTTLSLGRPSCLCEESEAKESHRLDLARLIMRAKATTELTERAVEELLESYLKNSDSELWMSPGCAIYLTWGKLGPDLSEDLHQIIPIESAILQVSQLQQIDSITSEAVIRDKNLFRAQSLIAVGLQEYQRNLLVGPDAPTIIDALTTKQGAEGLYDRLMDRVKILESMVSTRYSRTQSRRSISISIFGFLAVLLFLLPRITESLDTFARQGEWPVRVLSRIDEVVGGREPLVLWIYLFTVFAFVLTLIFVSIRPRFRPVRAHKFGYASRSDIQVVLVDSDESKLDDREPSDLKFLEAPGADRI